MTVVVSAAIEFIQLLTILLLHRVDTIFDVKDIVLNLAGGLLGLGLFYMFCAVAGGIRRKGQNHRNLTGFLLLVAANCRENRSSLCGAGQPEQAHCTGGI